MQELFVSRSTGTEYAPSELLERQFWDQMNEYGHSVPRYPEICQYSRNFELS